MCESCTSGEYHSYIHSITAHSWGVSSPGGPVWSTTTPTTGLSLLTAEQLYVIRGARRRDALLTTVCNRTGISTDPKTVVCDFEMAAMNAVRTTLGQYIAVPGCFFTSAKSHGARSMTWDWYGCTVTTPTSATSAAWWIGWRFCQWPMSPLCIAMEQGNSHPHVLLQVTGVGNGLLTTISRTWYRTEDYNTLSRLHTTLAWYACLQRTSFWTWSISQKLPRCKPMFPVWQTVNVIRSGIVWRCSSRNTSKIRRKQAEAESVSWNSKKLSTATMLVSRLHTIHFKGATGEACDLSNVHPSTSTTTFSAAHALTINILVFCALNIFVCTGNIWRHWLRQLHRITMLLLLLLLLL